MRCRAKELQRAGELVDGLARTTLVLEHEHALGTDCLHESLYLASIEAAHAGLSLACLLVTLERAAPILVVPLVEPGAVALHGVPQDGQQLGLGSDLLDDLRHPGQRLVARRPLPREVAGQARELAVVPVLLLVAQRVGVHAVEQMQLLAPRHAVDVGMAHEQRPPPRRAGLVYADTDEVRWSDGGTFGDGWGLAPAAVGLSSGFAAGISHGGRF